MNNLHDQCQMPLAPVFCFFWVGMNLFPFPCHIFIPYHFPGKINSSQANAPKVALVVLAMV